MVTWSIMHQSLLLTYSHEHTLTGWPSASVYFIVSLSYCYNHNSVLIASVHLAGTWLSAFSCLLFLWGLTFKFLVTSPVPISLVFSKFLHSLLPDFKAHTLSCTSGLCPTYWTGTFDTNSRLIRLVKPLDADPWEAAPPSDPCLYLWSHWLAIYLHIFHSINILMIPAYLVAKSPPWVMLGSCVSDHGERIPWIRK